MTMTNHPKRSDTANAVFWLAEMPPLALTAACVAAERMAKKKKRSKMSDFHHHHHHHSAAEAVDGFAENQAQDATNRARMK